jgi:hypothetical protein
MKLIVDVHRWSLTDERRQLEELRRLTSILWDSVVM